MENIAEPKNNINKQDTKREIIAVKECIFVCFIQRTTRIALEA
ncbi:hypothetical protein UF70_1082 [Staphylococcus pasteuri]|nr:hypothetical protein UF70_1082 [Staphylococcus pasteuri]